MKKFLKAAMWTLIVLIFVGTFVYLFVNSQSKPEVYETVSPEMRDIERTAVLTGKIEPRDEILIKPQISGIITKVNVEAGDQVQAGDVIATIKVIPEASQLSSASNRVETARIALEDARQKHERNKLLYDKKVISREEYEGTETTWKQARKELEGAQDALRVVQQGVSAMNASEASTQVRATISGLVLDVPVKVGTSVIQANTFNDGTTIATIADMGNLIFRGNVDETEVGSLRVGMPMTISIGALSDAHPSGILEYISPKGTDTSGANTFEIKAALADLPAGGIRAGYSANATVSLEKRNKVLSVPESVIEFANDSTFVYVLTSAAGQPQQWKRTAVKTGLSDGINIEIKDGITAKNALRGAKTEK